METKIKVVDRTNIVERLEPGDIVKSIEHGAIVLVVRVDVDGHSFDGFVLKKGDYPDKEENSLHLYFATTAFVPFRGVVTLTSE